MRSTYLRWVSATLGLSLVFIFLTSSARADVQPDLGVELVGDPFIAEIGDTYTRTLRITAGVQGVLSQVTVTSQGWTIQGFSLPASVSLQAGEMIEVPITIVASDPRRPLRLVGDFNGLAVRRVLDVSPRVSRWIQGRLGVNLTFPANDTTGVRSFATLTEEDAADEIAANDRRATRTIRARGTLLYPFELDLSDLRGVHGATVRIVDEQYLIPDRVLAETTTDADGNFDVEFEWSDGGLNGEPDLKFVLRAENSLFEVRAGTFAGTGLYKWQSEVQRNYTGTDWNVGSLYVTDEESSGSLHVLTSLWRTQLFMQGVGGGAGFGTPGFTVHWPEDGSSYTGWNSTIHIEEEDTYLDSTISHEYGHHWVKTYAESPAPDYDNGICDEGSPSHCIWCPENSTIGWTEGFPNLLGLIIPESYFATYGVAGSIRFDYRSETPQSSGSCTGTVVPNDIEGYTSALLLDIIDDVQDSNGSALYSDSLIEPLESVFTVADLDEPLSAREFIFAYLERYPLTARWLWETARSLGYQSIDTTGPDAPVGLTSTSHDVGVEIAQRRIELFWGDTDDDFSGVEDFSVQFSSSPSLPAEVVDYSTTSAAPSFTSRILEPGTWYASVRARDRAGNWSSDYSSIGPFEIREAIPADLAFGQPGAAWNGVFVLRGDDTANSTVVSPSPTLPGDQLSTYWNFGVQNLGDLSMGQPTIAQLYVDGDPVVGPGGRTTVGNLTAGQLTGYVNSGPIEVSGGRHTFSLRLDDGNTQVSESDESNNLIAFQRIFEPSFLGEDVITRRSAPPVADGGFDDLGLPPGTMLLQENKDGVRIDTSNTLWTATAMWTASATANYTLSMHPASAGQQDGFGPFILADALSGRSTGLLDFVVSHETQVGVDARDLGITRRDGGGPFDLLHRAVTTNEAGSVVIATLADGEPIEARSISVNEAFTGPKRLSVQTLSGAGPVSVSVFSPALEVGGPEDALATATTDDDGNAEFEADFDAVGSYLFVLWRDPSDGLAGDIQVRIDTFAASYVLAAATPSGWDASIVPRPDATGDAGSVALPDSLEGDLATTFLNASLVNLSEVGAPSAELVYRIDGSERVRALLPSASPGEVVSQNGIGPFEVRGGRHLISTRLDDPSVPVAEQRVASASQFVWRPRALSLGSAVQAPAPPDPLAGFGEALVLDELGYFVADGHRVPAASDRVTGVFVMPAPGEDVDLRAHPRSVGPRSGFAEALAFSGWPNGESDFVLHNGARAGGAPFDVGVFGLGASSPYLIQVVEQAPVPLVVGTPSSNSFGVLDLADIGSFVSATANAAYTLDLSTPLGQDVELGVSIYSTDDGFVGKSDAMALQIFAGDGSSQPLEFSVPSPGEYVVVVWRVANEANKMGTPFDYTIDLSASGATNAPPLGPDRSMVLLAPRPNPFNPRTEIQYQLREEDSVRLAIYSVRGQRVRTLDSGVRSPGLHRFVWDGRDDAGVEVTSGVYLVRLEGRSGSDMRKIALVR